MRLNQPIVTKVIIADDHTLFADGLEQIVNSSPGFEVIAKVNNGKMLLQTLNRYIPELILLDINMPLMDGLECVINIRKMFAAIKIILISMHDGSRYTDFIKEHDIQGFVMKNIGAPELRDVLQKVMAGQLIFLNNSKTNEAVISQPETSFMKLYKLTKTEIEIIQLIAKGWSTKIIADKRRLSPLTVETHRKNIFRKLNAKNMAEVVTFAVAQGIHKID